MLAYHYGGGANNNYEDTNGSKLSMLMKKYVLAITKYTGTA